MNLKVIGGLSGLALIAFANSASAQFTLNDCVKHLSHDVDAKFRKSEAEAHARCTIIASRLDIISKTILGTWTMRDDKGHLLRMRFLPDGTLLNHTFNYGSRQMEDRTDKWYADNPYGTVGAEGVELDGTHTSVEFKGRAMILTSQPASATIVDRWTRVR
jgi:hypothetical protein